MLQTLSDMMRSPWTRWVGFRYLRSKKRSGFLSLITGLSVTGVGLGVAVVIVVMSVMDGFESELKKRLSATELHIEITPTDEGTQPGGFVAPNYFDAQPIWNRWKNLPGIEEISPILGVEAILRTGRKVAGVMVKGIDEQRWARLKTTWLEQVDSKWLKDGESPLAGLVVGKELAYSLSLIPGDRIHLVSPTETQGPLGSVPLMKKFIVEAIYQSGVQDQELHSVFARDHAVQAYLRLKNVVTQWEVRVHPFDRAPELAQILRKDLSGAKIKDWIQLNSHLFASLRLERMAMFIILAFIIVVASFNIVTTLTMMVVEKKKEVAILRTMGATKSEVGSVFLFEGLLIGVLGTVGGIATAWVVCSVLKRYEFIQLPDIYYDRTLPVTFNGLYYAAVGIAGAMITLAACIYPTRRAAALDPLEGIRQGT